MTGTTTFVVYNWGWVVYILMVLALMAACVKVGITYGTRRERARHLIKPAIEPPKFRQRTREGDDARRHARQRTARIIPRRQPNPILRRGKPPES